MKAKAWKGPTYGVRVGRANARRHFKTDWRTVEVEIGGTVRTFRLRPAFWAKCPEIRGAAIGSWLKRNGLLPWPRGNPPDLELVHIAGNRFRLTLPSGSA